MRAGSKGTRNAVAGSGEEKSLLGARPAIWPPCFLARGKMPRVLLAVLCEPLAQLNGCRFTVTPWRRDCGCGFHRGAACCKGGPSGWARDTAPCVPVTTPERVCTMQRWPTCGDSGAADHFYIALVWKRSRHGREPEVRICRLRRPPRYPLIPAQPQPGALHSHEDFAWRPDRG